MRITILTMGTRGDVQPYLALALGLKASGHAVKLAASKDFAAMVTERGVDFAPLRFDIRQFLEDPANRGAFESKRAALALYRRVGPMMRGVLDDAWLAAQGADAILYHPKILNGPDIAEKLRVPGWIAFYLPALSPTRAFASPLLPGPPSWGGWLNRLSHHFFLRLMIVPFFRLINRWRVEALGLPREPYRGATWRRYGPRVMKLYGFSRHLVAPPGDWDKSAQVTGQWFLDSAANWTPPPELAEFLAAGPPAVAVGFGSIAGRTPERTTELVLEGLRLAGQRGVVVGGWGGLQRAEAPATVRFVEAVPYHWLLPRVAAVVHHGGAGSTAEGLRAGKPTVVCPFFGDQPYWGRRVQALGVGPAPVPQKRMTAAALAAAIREAVSNEEMRRRAEGLGGSLRAEKGVERAVELIEQELMGQGGVPAGPG